MQVRQVAVLKLSCQITLQMHLWRRTGIMERPTLTVCVIAKNEESNIGAALASVQGVADELIVVDTGSTDRTIEIARAFGAKIVHYPWNDDFSAARNAGIEAATGDWILMLDADETLPERSVIPLLAAIRNPYADGYLSAMVDCAGETSSAPVPIARLFRRDPRFRFVGRIHEQITPSIEAAGGCVVPLDMEIEHHGYTAAEDRRKGRRERNRRILEEEVAVNPQGPGGWYFLGLEDMIQLEYGRALDAFHRAASLGEHRSHPIMAAHRIVSIEVQRQRISRAWELAFWGANGLATRRDSALWVARLAEHEGDHVAVLVKVQEIRQMLSQPPSFGNYTVTPSLLDDLEASALWEQSRHAEALCLWESAVRENPTDLGLAFRWVSHKVLREGVRDGLLHSLQTVQSPAVASGCAAALLRAGEYDEVAKLARSRRDIGLTTNPLLYGLAWDGRWSELEEITDRTGVLGAIHLATAAAWFGQSTVLGRALDRLTGSWQQVMSAILSGEPLPEDLLWAADLLMVQWAELGCLPLLKKAAAVLPGTLSAGLARSALLLYRNHVREAAVQLALENPQEPDSAEVLGLFAHEAGDWEAAAQFLTQRIAAGPAPVRVYAKAAEALQHLGNQEIARVVLEIGAEHRPKSMLLRELLQAY